MGRYTVDRPIRTKTEHSNSLASRKCRPVVTPHYSQTHQPAQSPAAPSSHLTADYGLTNTGQTHHSCFELTKLPPLVTFQAVTEGRAPALERIVQVGVHP